MSDAASTEETQAKMHELRVERVARGLYERAMSERRTFSRNPQQFQGTWDELGERNRWSWLDAARRVLAGEDQFDAE